MTEFMTAGNAIDKIIIGIDPGTRLMGYGIIRIAHGVKSPELIAMGVIELQKFDDHYLRLRRIFDRVTMLIDQYKPDEMALEAPFFGKNVQSMLKLGRAQGVAMAAALERDIPISEYEPRRVKQSVTGSGSASKEQVRAMLTQLRGVTEKTFDGIPLDATDALAVALCHYYTTSGPLGATRVSTGAPHKRGRSSSWSSFVANNPDRINQLNHSDK